MFLIGVIGICDVSIFGEAVGVEIFGSGKYFAITFLIAKYLSVTSPASLSGAS
jgi:hypothetical protein